MKITFEFPEWEPQYKAALLELDQAKLLERVAAAEAAIRQRMRVIFGRMEGDTERQAIGKALLALGVLKVKIAHMPLPQTANWLCMTATSRLPILKLPGELCVR